MTTCKKCENQGTILLRKKDLYCQTCFLNNINHKFRACIGKNKILSANENVLVCLSGGQGSTSLVDFIHNGISLDNHKKLWITPVFLHIMEGQNAANDLLIAKSISEQCSHYNFSVHTAHISEYLLINDKKIKDVSELKINVKDQFEILVHSMAISAKNDFIIKAKRDIFKQYAMLLNCNFVFTAETSETLAVNLLSNLANGRGSQVQHDIGFCDNRDEIKIIRPLRDISQEELQHYINIKQLVPQSNYKNKDEISIQGVIQHFVRDLQENFQSTISTVCKTADKIGIYNSKNRTQKCKLCQSSIGEQEHTLSALEATNYSRTVSLGHPQLPTDKKNEKYLSMFPHVNEYLCYTCSRHFLEMDKSNLPIHLKEILVTETEN